MQILTPADFAKINELRTQALEEEAKNGAGNSARRKLAALSAARKANTGEADNFLTESSILGVRKRTKQSYEERMASIAEGREGRDKFGSNKHRKLSEKEHSTTNEEKKKKKNFSMVQHSNRVRKKNTASLHEKSRKLRKHIDRCAPGCFLVSISAYDPNSLTFSESSVEVDGATTARHCCESMYAISSWAHSRK